MNSVEFNRLTKHIYNKVFESFEKYDPDLVEADYNLDSVSVRFGDNTRFVVNRQPPVQQLWLATKDKGYHFNYNEETKEWICNKTQRGFIDIFNESVSQMIKQNYKIEL